jgi:hypothetical protein
MNRTLFVTPQAEADQATNWYEGQSLRAAARFREAVDHALKTISRIPSSTKLFIGKRAGYWWMIIRTLYFISSPKAG